MPWLPLHTVPADLPGPWPACAQSLVREGAAWLHTGTTRVGDLGGDLVALPGGPRLESRWVDGGWRSELDGRPLPHSPWEALEAARRRHPLPWVGSASYEVACWEGGLPHQAPPEGTLGMAWQGVRQALRVQEGRGEWWIFEGTEQPPALAPTCALGRARITLQCAWEEPRHRAAVEEIRRLIHDGAFYVANLCVPFSGTLEGDPVTLALSALRRARPPYGAFLPAGDGHLLCLSMERLLARRGDRLWTEPIKGSAPLLGIPEQDFPAGEVLQDDPKERAEHTMIVDLLRNDLGRISATGSVQVERLMALEPYPTVQHLVSRVASRARPGLALPDLLRALLPGGSVTGAPKHAVCAHLARTEEGPRGFYCGALGWITPDGDLDLALPIRTAHLQGDRLRYWAGGGITRRSVAAREWEELELKTRVLGGVKAGR